MPWSEFTLTKFFTAHIQMWCYFYTPCERLRFENVLHLPITYMHTYIVTIKEINHSPMLWQTIDRSDATLNLVPKAPANIHYMYPVIRIQNYNGQLQKQWLSICYWNSNNKAHIVPRATHTPFINTRNFSRPLLSTFETK